MPSIKDENLHDLRTAQAKLISDYCAMVIAGKIPLTNHYEEFVENMANYAGPLMRSGKLPRYLCLPSDYPMIKAFRKTMKALGIRPIGSSIPRGKDLLLERDIA